MSDFVETEVLPPLTITAVGSLPHTNPSSAVELILTSLTHAAHPPQLPFADPREQMWIQFTEGFPRFHVDVETLNYGFDTSGDVSREIEDFYTRYMAVTDGGMADAFDIGPAYGQGIRLFLDRIQQEGRKRPLIKVQVTGPLSFALTVTDEHKRPIFYHSLFRDIAVKGIGMKAVRLLELFKPLAENVILIFDEPSLSAYGSSAFLGVSKADVIESLDEVIALVVERGGIPGVHCCGNTDWGLLMETSTRVINFDAVDYMDTMAIYGPQVNRFLSRGGVLSWGAVSNTPAIESETAADVVGRIERGLSSLEAVGVDREAMTDKMIITPACGCASLTLSQAEKVYTVLSELEKALSLDTFRNGARPRLA